MSIIVPYSSFSYSRDFDNLIPTNFALAIKKIFVLYKETINVERNLLKLIKIFFEPTLREYNCMINSAFGLMKTDFV